MVYRTSSELGALEAEYRPSRLIGVAAWSAVVVSPVVGVLATIGTLADPARKPEHMLEAVAIVLFGPALLFWWLRARRQRAELHTEGLAYWKGAAPWTTRWDRVVRVFASHTKVHLLLPAQHAYTVERDDGSRVELTSALARVRELGTAIEARTLAHMLQRAREMLGRGEAVYFGPLAVSTEGIAHNGQWQPWAAVRDVSLSDGQIAVTLQSQLFAWAKASYASVPNAHVLLAMIPPLRAEALGRAA